MTTTTIPALTAAQITALDALTNHYPELKKTVLGTGAPRLGTIIDGVDDRVVSLEASLVLTGDARLRWKKIHITAAAGTSENDTAYDLPAGAVLERVLLEVKTAEATGSTKTIDVGLLSSESGGDADGFLDGISTAATGIIQPKWNQTVGSNNTYLGAASTHTRGALLTELLIAGNDVTSGGDGFAAAKAHVTSSVTAKSVTWTAGSAQTEFDGYLWLGYTLLVG